MSPLSFDSHGCRWFICCALYLSGAPTFAQPAPDIELAGDRIVVAHGSFFDREGNAFVPDRDYILAIQAGIIDWSDDGFDASADTYGQARRARAEIRRAVADDVLANALYIDWLVDNDIVVLSARRRAVSGALRQHYIDSVASTSRVATRGSWTRGLEPEAITRLADAGIVSLHHAGEDTRRYAQSCRDQGVPVPRSVLSDEWRNLGSYQGKISNIGGTPRLWAFYDDEPDGTCLAVTFTSATSVHLDMICLGRQTSKACYFENNLQGDVSALPLDELNAGDSGLQGVCSDCHAGENPFIVHPDKAAFAALDRSRLMPVDWPTHLGLADWPQSDPTTILEAVSSTGQCIDCHFQGYAGRFPELSEDHPGYCAILRVIATDNARRTMPAQGALYADIAHYKPHVDALLALCDTAPGSAGEVVEYEPVDDPDFITAPTVLGRIYECESPPAAAGAGLTMVGAALDGAGSPTDPEHVVRVGGVLLNATVRLSVNGIERAVRSLIRDPDSVELSVALDIGDEVTAVQEFDGTRSEPSAPVVVRSYEQDFPDGLPAPEVSPPLIHECASLIGVRSVPGSTVTVTVNGQQPFSWVTTGRHTVLPPNKAPFEIGDAFVAESRMCQDNSPPSAPRFAVAAPAALPPLRVLPPQPVEGAELVSFEQLTNGSSIDIELAGNPTPLGFSWALPARRNIDIASRIGRPLRESDEWTIRQTLCDVVSIDARSIGGIGCDEIPPPRIEPPLAGTDFVIVTEAIPGARLRIHDASDTELGDASGSVINLSRVLDASDTLVATQQIGTCSNGLGFRIDVR